MFHLDNSETSWLVYTDWLEDQDVDATHIRQAVVESTISQWHYEYLHSGIYDVCSFDVKTFVGVGTDFGVVANGSDEHEHLLKGLAGVGTEENSVGI